MKTLVKLLITAALVMGLSEVLPGIHTTNYLNAILVALALSILNFIIKPILIILTLPITVFTFGLFLLVINVIIIYLAGWLVPGFNVEGFFWVLIFSVLLTISRSFLFNLLDKE